MLGRRGAESCMLETAIRMLTDRGAVVHAAFADRTGNETGSDLNRAREQLTEIPLGEAEPGDYHAAILPGDRASVELLRSSTEAISFIREFADRCVPIATIGYGPKLLIDCGLVDGFKVTSDPTIRGELEDAGATWNDTEVITDRILVTGRGPEDAEAFGATIVVEIAKGIIAGQSAG